MSSCPARPPRRRSSTGCKERRWRRWLQAGPENRRWLAASGRRRTAWLAISGGTIGASTALAWRLIDGIADDEP